jgi:hypothetical protein
MMGRSGSTTSSTTDANHSSEPGIAIAILQRDFATEAFDYSSELASMVAPKSNQ